MPERSESREPARSHGSPRRIYFRDWGKADVIQADVLISRVCKEGRRAVAKTDRTDRSTAEIYLDIAGSAADPGVDGARITRQDAASVSDRTTEQGDGWCNRGPRGRRRDNIEESILVGVAVGRIINHIDVEELEGNVRYATDVGDRVESECSRHEVAIAACGEVERQFQSLLSGAQAAIESASNGRSRRVTGN